MTLTLGAGWRDQFVLSRNCRRLGRQAELAAAVRSGELVRVIRGVYRHADAVVVDSSAAGDDAFLARVRATQLLAAEPVTFCGFAAAAVWQLPIIGAWPDRVSVSSPRAAGGRSNASVSRSYLGHPVPTDDRDGLRVTTLARTVVDVARIGTFGQAVAMADSALHGQGASSRLRARTPTAHEALRAESDALGPVAGAFLCRGVLRFADGASGSAGESVSRVGFHLLGLPAPLLQVPFYDSSGLIGIVDFWWPDLGLIGGFDGVAKYVRDEFTRGRPAAQVEMEEKAREDRLRALGARVVRWGWDVATSLPRLRSHLTAAGLR
jgi:hypothetical protein